MMGDSKHLDSVVSFAKDNVKRKLFKANASYAWASLDSMTVRGFGGPRHSCLKRSKVGSAEARTT